MRILILLSRLLPVVATAIEAISQVLKEEQAEQQQPGEVTPPENGAVATTNATRSRKTT